MKNWFLGLTQREQLSVLVLGIALALFAFYTLVWAPLNDRRDALAEQNAAIAQSLTRVDAMVSELLALRDSGARPSARRNLTSVINESTRRLQIPVSRLQPNSRGEIQVRLENAAFDDVLGWLYEIEFGEGLLVREVSITETGTVGRVNASVRVAQPG